MTNNQIDLSKKKEKRKITHTLIYAAALHEPHRHKNKTIDF